MKKGFISICAFLFLVRSYASDSTSLKALAGVYKFGQETISLDTKDNTFFLKRFWPKSQDVVIPVCYDTIAKGHFKILNKSTVVLLNDKCFLKAHYDFKQERRLSEDTVYIKIAPPQDDAFFSGRFRYLFNLGCIMNQIRSDSTFLKIPKNKIGNCQSPFLSFLIQDLSPQTCREDERCYQRIYFRIFESLGMGNDKNYFTISLPGFTECFVERMDVDNDYIYFDGRNLFWRGNEYKKVSQADNRDKVALHESSHSH